MSTQLVLIETDEEPEWRLDPHTIEIGLRGVAAAREVLRQHRRPETPPPAPRRHAA